METGGEEHKGKKLTGDKAKKKCRSNEIGKKKQFFHKVNYPAPRKRKREGRGKSQKNLGKKKCWGKGVLLGAYIGKPGPQSIPIRKEKKKEPTSRAREGGRKVLTPTGGGGGESRTWEAAMEKNPWGNFLRNKRCST